MADRRGRPGATGAEGRAGAAGTTGPAGPRGPVGRNAAAGFLILMTFSFFGFVRVEQEAKRALEADREGCARVNVLRVNQAEQTTGDIERTQSTLAGRLGPLEPLRKQIEEGLEADRTALKELRESVSDHPVKGRPYETDCADAYP